MAIEHEQVRKSGWARVEEGGMACVVKVVVEGGGAEGRTEESAGLQRR